MTNKAEEIKTAAQRLDHATARQATALKELGIAKKEWIEQFKRFAPKWAEMQAAAEYAGATQRQNVDLNSAKAAKEEVRRLTESLPSIVEQRLTTSAAWPDPMKADGVDLEKGPIAGARSILWDLYEILQRYGLASATTLQDGKRSHGQYPYSLNFPTEMNETLKRYERLFNEHSSLRSSIEQLEEMKRNLEAQATWETL